MTRIIWLQFSILIDYSHRSTEISLSNYMQPLSRRCVLHERFDCFKDYADELYFATREEFILNYMITMKSLETTTLRHFMPVVDLKTVNMYVFLYNSLQYLLYSVAYNFNLISIFTYITNSAMQSLKTPRFDIVASKMRDRGIPIFCGVEVSMRSSSHTYHQDQRSLGKSISTGICVKVSQQQLINIKKKACFSKNDIWVLWVPESTVCSNPVGFFDGCDLSTKQDFSRNAQAVSKARMEFSTLRQQGCYLLPWYQGYVWQHVWVLRSAWFGFSSEGALEMMTFDGSVAQHPFLQRYVAQNRDQGKTSSFSALRIHNDSQGLMTLDLLRGGITSRSTQLSKSVSSKILEIESACPIFRKILSHQPQTPGEVFPILNDEMIFLVLQTLFREFRLNDDQRNIITHVSKWFSSSSSEVDDIILIHGVFGSGKSYLLSILCVLITRLSKISEAKVKVKTMISSNTNVAVDRILVQLMSIDESEGPRPIVTRVGCLDKVDKALIVGGNFVHATESKNFIIKEFDKLLESTSDPQLRAVMEATASNPSFEDSQKARLEMADVIGVTCASTSSALLSNIQCDILILDEVSQMTEALSLLPIACCKPMKLLLVGDPYQLGPAVSILSSTRASSPCGLFDYSNTLFDRMLAIGYKQHPLRVQYRCHPEIAEVCNKLFYDGTLQHGISVSDRIAIFPHLSPVIVFHNDSDDVKIGDSCANRGEAMSVLTLLSYLQGLGGSDGMSTVSYGVICMYKAQAFEINKLMSESIRFKSISNTVVSTVDAFQGREMDVIIICTSKNSVSEFLSNSNRVNVAISRAKYHLFVVGNVDVLKHCPLWGKVIELSSLRLMSIQDLHEMCTSPSSSKRG
jgi:hypothetical protein